jgi:hypothetical protein
VGKSVAVNELGLRIGETHPRSTIPDSVVDQMRDLHEIHKKSYGQISLRFKIPLRTVAKICRYERRNQVISRWKRVEI